MAGEELGALLGARALAALDIPGDTVESFGKATAIGAEGESSTAPR